MGWEVPELDEQQARKLLFNAIHDALAKVEAENQGSTRPWVSDNCLPNFLANKPIWVL
jgi:hypothetical protein